MLQILSWEMGAREAQKHPHSQALKALGAKPRSGGSISPAVSSHSEDDTHRVQAAIPCLMEFSIFGGM